MAFYDYLETAQPEAREARLFHQLREQVTLAILGSKFYRKTLSEIRPEFLVDRSALQKLPILYKSNLIELQEQHSPFGGVAVAADSDINRLFLSPGPIAELQAGTQDDQWRMARALCAAGFTSGDKVANCFNYHFTPAGFMFDEALHRTGCSVFAGGIGSTHLQVEAFNRFNLNGYVGTPEFLKTIVEAAQSKSTPIKTIARGLVSGGPLLPYLRDWYDSSGIKIRQCYGTAELGLIAYESTHPNEGMIIDENCIVEIVRPGSQETVTDGEVGEVVVTSFNPHFPFIRFATGDLSAIAPGQSSCGRTNTLLRGWLGRTDQATKIRGMFVHPHQVAHIIAPFPSIVRGRIEITEVEGVDQLHMLCECKLVEEGLNEQIIEAIRTQCQLRGTVSFVAPTSLPNDGKVIDDKRVF